MSDTLHPPAAFSTAWSESQKGLPSFLASRLPIVLFPAPVLPTTPIFYPFSTLKDNLFKTISVFGLYLRLTSLKAIFPSSGQSGLSLSKFELSWFDIIYWDYIKCSFSWLFYELIRFSSSFSLVLMILFIFSVCIDVFFSKINELNSSL